jgi:serine/threonine-protein kinase
MATMPLVGDEFAGYRLLSVLGRGGMSVVYQAENPRLGSVVALKVLAPELADDDIFRARFLQESRTAAGLNHPHVIPIHDMGSAGDLLFIAMRYVSGADLRSLLRAHRRLTPTQALLLTGQTGRALDFAHAHDLVHRDIKPANILVERAVEDDEPDHVYLADFGITKHALSRSGLTPTGQFMGTLDYVAPEQIQGRAVDKHADIYSLGCVLFECLTGQVPFVKDVDAAVLWAHVEESAPHPSDLRAGLPPGIDAVLDRALAKHPEDRYDSCKDLTTAARTAFGNPDLSTERVLSRHPAGHPSTQAPPAAAVVDPPPPAPPQAPVQGEALTIIPGRHTEQPPDGPAPTSALADPAVDAAADLGTGRADIGDTRDSHNASHVAGLTGDARSRVRRRLLLGAGLVVLVLIAAWAWVNSPNSNPPAARNLVAIRHGAAHTGASTPTMPMTPSASGTNTNPGMASNRLMQAVKGANQGTGMLPPASCTVLSDSHVHCTHPYDGADSVDLRTYPNPNSLYRHYMTRARALQGGPVPVNTTKCTKRSSYGEVSWNHDYHQSNQYSLASMRAGKVQDEQAVGRVFCYFGNGTDHVVWTVDDGNLLGEVDGFPHPSTWHWWHTMHHEIQVQPMNTG